MTDMTGNFVCDTEPGAVYLEGGSTFNVGNGQTELFGNSAQSWGGEMRSDMENIRSILHALRYGDGNNVGVVL